VLAHREPGQAVIFADAGITSVKNPVLQRHHGANDLAQRTISIAIWPTPMKSGVTVRTVRSSRDRIVLLSVVRAAR
jgi:hypothetical protein